MYPEINQKQLEAMNAINNLKSQINTVKNNLAEDAELPSKLIAFRDDPKTSEADKTAMQDALNINATLKKDIEDQGF